MTQSTTAIVKQSSKQNQEWLDKMPQLENDEKRMLAIMDQCYNAFLAGSETIRELAVKQDIPYDVIHSWAKGGKWVERRELFRQELLVNVEMEYAEFVRRERVATAQEVVESVRPLIKDIAEGIASAVQQDNTVAVRRLAESLKHVSDIVSKAVGLDAPLPQSDRPAVAKNAIEEGGKQPFFNINTQGPVSITPGTAPEERKVIDV
jgi:hypothetical protein